MMEALMIAATIATTVSAYASGKQQQRAYEAAAQADAYNAAVAKQKSDQVLSAAGQREEQQRRAARIAEGKMRAAMAESGAGVDGSNADVLRQSEIFAELDALNIRYEGETESRGLLAQSKLDSYSAGVNRNNAAAAGQMAVLNTASALLSGASNYSKNKGK